MLTTDKANIKGWTNRNELFDSIDLDAGESEQVDGDALAKELFEKLNFPFPIE